jgi:hypothetical protein
VIISLFSFNSIFGRSSELSALVHPLKIGQTTPHGRCPILWPDNIGVSISITLGPQTIKVLSKSVALGQFSHVMIGRRLASSICLGSATIFHESNLSHYITNRYLWCCTNICNYTSSKLTAAICQLRITKPCSSGTSRGSALRLT